MLIREHLNTWDHAVILRVNRINRRHIGRFFALISRLGDGSFWLAVIIAIPFCYGPSAFPFSMLMLVCGAIATIIYKIIKQSTHRIRPCHDTPSLILTVAPLDRFSFPSGHTLHAVCFTWMTCAAIPSWSWFLVPFCVLVGLSRMVLGLHYLSDVLVGACIGGTIGVLGTLAGRCWGINF
jgi:undecaprenyl-diphosphatase